MKIELDVHTHTIASGHAFSTIFGEERTMEHFKAELIDYLYYYNNRRIKLKLKGLTPAQHRYQTLQVA